MSVRSREFADLTIEGVCVGTGRNRDDSASYVRFQGEQGQIAVLVDDDCPGAPRDIRKGDRFRIVLDYAPRQMGAGLLVALSVEVVESPPMVGPVAKGA